MSMENQVIKLFVNYSLHVSLKISNRLRNTSQGISNAVIKTRFSRIETLTKVFPDSQSQCLTLFLIAQLFISIS